MGFFFMFVIIINLFQAGSAMFSSCFPIHKNKKHHWFYSSSSFSTLIKAFCGISTLPI